MRRKWSLLLTVVVLAALLVTLRFVQVGRGNERAQRAVQDLFQALSSGESQLVQGLLTEGAREQSLELKSLAVVNKALGKYVGPQYSVQRSLWSSTVRVAVPLKLPTSEEVLLFTVRDAGGASYITTLPEVLAHPAALVQEVNSVISAKITIYGVAQEVALATPLKSGEVGLTVILNGRLVHFSPAQITPVGRVLRYAQGGLFEGEYKVGTLSRDASFYSIVRGHAPELVGSLLPGSPNVGVVEWDGAIYAAVATQRFVPESIRVVLNTTTYQGLVHEEVLLWSPVGLRLTDKLSGISAQVPPGVNVRFVRGAEGITAAVQGRDVLSASHRIFVEPQNSSRVTVQNISRALGKPAYRGVLEVSLAASAKGLVLVNEVSLNQYLYSVVPSEMPVSFGLEALKAQALAARAYAVTGILSGGYRAYGAHVEDSVLSQVYNNIQEQPLSTLAVDATEGLLPTFGGEVVDARFFSTSSGFTSNHHEVWSDGPQFPGREIPYLVASPQSSQVSQIGDEAAVQAFLRRTDLDSPDADAPYFRWSVSFTRPELEAVIDHNLSSRLAAQPSFVAKVAGNGGAGIGTLQDIRVVSRGQGGNILELEVVGSLCTYRVAKEYNVRTLLRPVQYIAGRPAIRLQLLGGGTASNYPLLPSAFAYFELTRGADGTIERVTIYGGGNGHGVGLSQTGARGLAREGRSFAEIISHYYPGSTITPLAELFR